MLNKSNAYTKHSWAIVSALVALFCVGCGSSPYPPVAQDQRTYEPDYNYIIGPGDTMQIFVWGNEELTTSGVVRPDGKLTTRLVEDLEASGKTSTVLARDIEAAMRIIEGSARSMGIEVV